MQKQFAAVSLPDRFYRLEAAWNFVFAVFAPPRLFSKRLRLQFTQPPR